MTLRQYFKYWFYGYCPGFAGAFTYFGTKVHFPRGSLSFLAACQQGIFEADNVRLLQGLVRPGSWFFDVGANIGLMSVPVLRAVAGARVLSFEPSPNSIPWLRRTIEQSSFRDRWTLITKAVGEQAGPFAFSVSATEASLYDGLKNARPGAVMRTLEVEQTTLDASWKEFGAPDVSVIKCDVEGGEFAVLQGARECLATSRPAVLTEWNRQNLAAYGYQPGVLLEFADSHDFHVFAVPGISRVMSLRELEAHMVFTETFLLLPRSKRTAEGA